MSGRAIYFVTLILSLIKFLLQSFSPVLITARPLRRSRRNEFISKRSNCPSGFVQISRRTSP